MPRDPTIATKPAPPSLPSRPWPLAASVLFEHYSGLRPSALPSSSPASRNRPWWLNGWDGVTASLLHILLRSGIADAVHFANTAEVPLAAPGRKTRD